MTDIMKQLDEILKGKGVEVGEASTPTPETITIPLRHLYVLYAWASAGHDAITGRMGRAMCAVLLAGIGVTGPSQVEAFEVYSEMLHEFADRTDGYCDSNVNPRDSIAFAMRMMRELDEIDRQMGKPIGNWKTV